MSAHEVNHSDCYLRRSDCADTRVEELLPRHPSPQRNTTTWADSGHFEFVCLFAGLRSWFLAFTRVGTGRHSRSHGQCSGTFLPWSGGQIYGGQDPYRRLRFPTRILRGSLGPQRKVRSLCYGCLTFFTTYAVQ